MENRGSWLAAGWDRAAGRGLRLLAAGMLLACTPALAAGTWTRLNRGAPGEVALMLLLPDGSVMAANQPGSGIGRAWFRLTPDNHGSYVNGTWTTLASMHDTRLWYASQVLRDGRVFVAGGEYGTGGTGAEVYDPGSNTWTMLPSTSQNYFDAISELLPNGNVLIAPVFPKSAGGTSIYVPTANTWIAGPRLVRGFYQDEASWVKLPDDSILTIDPFGTNSERYIPSLNVWTNDSVCPQAMYDPLGGELGAGFLLPDGRAFYLGGTGHTLFYTPSGSPRPGVWSIGADVPNGLATDDAPAAMMVNGKILCAVAPPIYADGNGNNVFPSPTSFYEFDPVANAFAQVNGPNGPTEDAPSYISMMLDLPDGTVLYSHFGTDVYVYRPDGSPLAAGKPTITSITLNPDRSYHLTGTLLNGISEGAAYGDDAQMNTDYPLIRLTDASGNIYYARTHDWSGTSIMTGSRPLTTEFNLPAGLPDGVFSLVVVANGISSDAITFSSIPLTITSQPQGLTVFQPDSAAFSVGATGISPVAFQWQLNGAPLAGATNSTLILSNVQPSQAGNYSVVVSNPSGSLTSADAPLVVIPTVPLPVALDATNLSWTTDGDAQWHGLTALSHYGGSAGQSGPLGDGQSSRLATTVNGPGTLTFWWKVSSATNADFLTFAANGVTQAAISGEVDWSPMTVYLEVGPQTLQWTYAKTNSGGSGLDAGWVDEVGYVAGGVGPIISTQPAGVDVVAQTPVSFNVGAGGTPPLRYQWWFDGAPLPGATNSSLNLPQPWFTNAGLYSVAITNGYGFALSSNAPLAVLGVAAFGNDVFNQVTLVPALVDVVGIAAGAYHSLALRRDGSVVAWGDDYSGQCDLPPGLGSVVAVAAGGYHSLALRSDGSIVAWGDDSSGQIDVPPNATNIVAIAAGDWHSVALRADGRLLAWGDNSWGQTQVPAFTNGIAIAAGSGHNLVLKSDGTVTGWGNDLAADGSYGGQIDVPPGLNHVVAVAAGAAHSLALTASGGVVGWGDNSQGQTSVPAALTRAVALGAGGDHSLAVQEGGTVVAWGNNDNGQSLVGPHVLSASAVAAGSYHSIVLLGVTPAGPRLSPLGRHGSTVTLALAASRGKTYFLEYKNSLSDPVWTTLFGVAGKGIFQTIADPSATGARRFYRVRQQ